MAFSDRVLRAQQLAYGFAGALGGLLRPSSPEPIKPTATGPIAPNNTHTGPKRGLNRVESRRLKRRGKIHASTRRVRTRWYPGDEETALHLAEQGNLLRACQLIDAMRSDGLIRALTEIRSNGLIKLPVEFSGDPELCKELAGDPEKNDDGLFWQIAPSNEQARIIRWAINLGAGFGYIVNNDDDPLGDGVLTCVDPHHVRVVTTGPDQGRMFYQTDDEGEIEIIEGDGKWFVYYPYGKHRFWLEGAWLAAAEAWLSKKDSRLQRNAWGRRLAAGIMHWKAPHASSDRQRDNIRSLFASLTDPPIVVTKKDSQDKGWDLDYQESTGRGYEVWKQERSEANEEICIIYTGSPVSVYGTPGFASGDIQETVSHTFVESNGKTYSETVTNNLLAPLAERRGSNGVTVSWKTTRASDKKTEGEALSAFGAGVIATNQSLKDYGKRLRIDPQVANSGIEIEDIAQPVNANLPVQASIIDDNDVDDTPEHLAALADSMNFYKETHCECGKRNKCRVCGVQRLRVAAGKDAQGKTIWKSTWVPFVEMRSINFIPKSFCNIPIEIERPIGSVRTGTSPDGLKWSVIMTAHYGDIPGTVGNDGEALDFYLAENPKGQTVYILEQLTSKGDLDEYKLFMGFPNVESVIDCYLAHVPRPELIGEILEMPIAVITGLCGNEPITRGLSAIVREHQNA